MPKDTQDIQDIIARLRNHPLVSPKHCDNCGKAYNQSDLTYLGTGSGGLNFQTACSGCGLVQMSRVLPGGAVSIQRFEANNSDLQGAEMSKFAGKPSVAKEEALEVYQGMIAVKNIDDFLQLLESDKTN